MGTLCLTWALIFFFLFSEIWVLGYGNLYTDSSNFSFLMAELIVFFCMEFTFPGVSTL